VGNLKARHEKLIVNEIAEPVYEVHISFDIDAIWILNYVLLLGTLQLEDLKQSRLFNFLIRSKAEES